MQFGLQLYGSQLAPSASSTGLAAYRGGADCYRLVGGGSAGDFLLIGGAAPSGLGEGGGLGRAGDLIVPLAAAALSMAARNIDIITKLNAWAFDPAHIARIGSSLAALTGERWSLYLDAAPGQWQGQPVDDAVLAERTREVLAIVAQHWLGRAEFVGKHVSSTGRMVGPRPSNQPSLLLDAAMAEAIGATAVPVTQQVIAYGAGSMASPNAKASLLTCPVILGRTDAEAQAIAQECRSLRIERCLIGAPAQVAQKIRAAAQQSKAARVAISFPALRAIELELFDQTLMPMLRANAAVAS